MIVLHRIKGTLAIGLMESIMERGLSSGETNLSIVESIYLGKSRVMGHLYTKIITFIRDIGLMGNSMEEEFCTMKGLSR